MIKWSYYKIERIDKPNPGPIPDPTPDPGPTPPEPDPVPPPEKKYEVCFFYEADKLDDGIYTDDQILMFCSRKFREELEAKGHDLVGSIDSNACKNGQCTVEDKKRKPFFQEASKYKKPCVVISEIGSKRFQCYQMPDTKDTFYKLIGETP